VYSWLGKAREPGTQAARHQEEKRNCFQEIYKRRLEGFRYIFIHGEVVYVFLPRTNKTNGVTEGRNDGK
jgi:hypothetical protein